MAKNTDPQNEKAPKAGKGEQGEQTPTSGPSDSQIKEGSEQSIQNMHEGAKQQAAQKAKQAQQEATPVERQRILTIREINNVPHRVVTSEDGTEETAEFAPSQAEAYNRYKKIEWENDGEKAAAEAVTRYAFGEKKEEFEKGIHEMSDEEKKAVLKIAKKLELGDIVNAKLLRHIEKEEENED